MRRFLASLLAILMWLPAAQASEPAIPPELQAWRDWSLHGAENVRCPFLAGDADQRYCAWPGPLDLSVTGTGARFTVTVQAYAETWFALPGDATHWPQDVVANGKSLAVVEKDGLPQVKLVTGTYHIVGALYWEKRPESLSLGAATGLITLTLDGKLQAASVDADGLLWFGRTAMAASEEGERNTSVTRVFRQLADGVPLRLLTRVELDVAGEDREILLGHALPPGFAPVSLSGGLPARLEKNGDVRVQVRAGRWVLLLDARQLAATQDYRVTALTDVPGRTAEGDHWPTQEVWVFLADHRLRTVRIEGASTVDPRQIGLPEQWQALPAYLLAGDTVLKLIEQGRGDINPQPEPLTLKRELWLDFDGAGLTVRDHLAGQLERSGRLAFAAGVSPGRVTQNGEPQVITALPAADNANTQPGIEVRPGDLAVEAVSRVMPADNFVATGFARDVQRLSATLQLPPGWTLFAARGVDRADPSWVSGWTLWDIFLVLVLTVAVARMSDLRVGALMLITLVLTHDIAGAPVFLWLNLVGVLAIWQTLPAGRLQQWASWYRWLSVAALVVVALLFAVSQVRQGLYPVLEYPGRNIHVEADNYADAADAAMAENVMAESAPPEDMKWRSRGELKKLYFNAPAAPQPLKTLDPDARVQTGPGVPDWSWRAVSLHWQGPVGQTQRVDFWFINPLTNRILCFARVALIALLMLALWRGALPDMRLSRFTSTASLAFISGALLLITTTLPTVAVAEIPDAALLMELRTRLTAAPDCLPSCAAIERAHLDANAERMVLRLRVAAAARVGVPLPTTGNAWRARSVMLDGKPAMTAMNDGQLLLAVEPGMHDVVLEGPVGTSDALQFSFALRPGYVTATASGWQVAGIVDGQLPGGALDLRRSADAQRVLTEEKRLLNDPEPIFVIVERTLRFDIDWHIETSVTRVAPSTDPITVDVPLLAGETVVSRVNIKDGKVVVALAQEQNIARWTSVIKPISSLTLTAPSDAPWVERWHVDVSTRWHVDAAGIPPIKDADGIAWYPWPGEQLALSMVRPQAIAGETLTIEKLRIAHHPGHRVSSTEMTLALLSSEGGKYRFRLPTGVTLESIVIDGMPQVIAGDGAEAIIPLHPGVQSAVVRWRDAAGMGVIATTPALDFGRAITNIDTELHVPDERWPLFIGGPGAGPVVLYWGVLLVVLGVAVVLARLPGSPLRTYEWVLLGLGMSSMMLPWTLLVAAWFFVVAARARITPEKLTPRVFNLMQISLAFYTLIAMSGLLATIPQSLVLAQPDMQITGNGSHAGWLHWFVDRTDGPLPQGWMVSLPMWAYRLAMLAWSLWLALAVTRWLRWAWQSYSTNGLWHTSIKDNPSK